MEKKLSDMLTDGIHNVDLFSTPFSADKEGIMMYYSLTNNKRSDPHDHSPEALLFLAYLRHNPPQGVSKDKVKGLLTVTLKQLCNYNNGNDTIREYAQSLTPTERVSLADDLSMKIGQVMNIAGRYPADSPKKDRGFRYHLDHAFTPLMLYLR